MTDMEKKIDDLCRVVAIHTEQIKTLFNQQECLDEMTKAVTTLAVKMENVENGQAKIEKGLEDLKSVPAKNWQSLIAALISGAVGAIIGAVVAILT